MSQTLVDALDALEGQIEALSARIKTVDPDALGRKAAEGASRGASGAMSDLRETSYSLQETARGLKDAVYTFREWAIPAAERAAEAEQRRRWWKQPALVVLTVLLVLLGGFTGGVVVTRTGLIVSTEAGCRYLGGEWVWFETKVGGRWRSTYCLIESVR